jgi:DNA repair exonuclease SbcCD ATPase subunit
MITSSQLTGLRSELSKQVCKFQAAKTALETTRESLAQARKEQEALFEAKAIVQSIGLECQETCQKQIAYVVSRCLKAVFGESALRFELVFETKRGQTEARGIFVDTEGNHLDPLDSCGGGLLDVAAFGLRLACMMLSRPRPARVLVLDEPFKFVSSGYRENLVALLAELSEEFGLQVILITHLPELMAFPNQVQIDA